jgi:hypothetical protein
MTFPMTNLSIKRLIRNKELGGFISFEISTKVLLNSQYETLDGLVLKIDDATERDLVIRLNLNLDLLSDMQFKISDIDHTIFDLNYQSYDQHFTNFSRKRFKLK